ncbi:hypothetical protein GCM10018790_16140 [Kitasatospora xanthocidica]|uniref:hypothetical protein n=1 Tax=Kitasatospora xanthocidica TaxID=83382 RepID=UPI00167A2817|nr:hypothetical protein [Kitasatospora xanthocidica]GHF39102.1 hypothetical protein GCM10018790_16140 [Kitasatospora xanthocidica]
MNHDNDAAYSSAAYDSTVGIQAGTVHNSNVYFVHPDASPQEKYRLGVRFLEDGVPSRAREMITDAMVHGCDGAEVRFHWVLAVLSARTYQDLTTEDVHRLHYTSGLVRIYAEGEWKEALRVVFDLLAVLSAAGGETGAVLKQLHDLPSRQREAILRHLDLMLTGGLKDDLWAETCERAGAERFGNDRVRRVWAYFAPDPIGARAVPPRPSAVAAARAALPVRAALFAFSSALLWALALIANPVWAAAELLVALGAGLTAARSGLRWWGRELRSDLTAGARVPHPRGPASPEDGFTNRVRHSFDHYFSVRTPYGFPPDAWLAHTVQIRGSLAAEIADLYRESRIGVERVTWLIRYLAEDARNRHNNGTLFDRHRQDPTPARTKALTVAALAILGASALAASGTAISGAASPQPLWAFLAVLGAAWSGHAAASRWLEIRREEHRLARETQEYHEQLTARQIAHRRWKEFLDVTRPTELEMETWLTCDKTSFVDEALRYHRLTWRDLVTHTILVAPAPSCKRGRVRGGPWRYSHYVFRLFLFTQDGVREVSSEFNSSDATRRNEQRSNYRFDALSYVQVTENADIGYDLELVLTNGPARKIRVKDADAHHLAPAENAQEISEINLSAAGSTHAFRILEGVAADGKGWIERHSPNNLTPFQIAG